MGNETSQVKYAGFWRRFFAISIDFVIVSIIGISISLTLGNNPFLSSPPANAIVALDYVLTFFFAALYSIIFFVKSDGQTVGMKLLQIQLIKEGDNKTIDGGTAVIRYIISIVSSIVLFLGYIWMLFDNKKQTWHDKAAKTVVIEKEEPVNTALVVLLIIGCLFFEIGTSLARSQANKNLKPAEDSKVTNNLSINPEAVATDVLPKINKFRLESKLTEIKENPILCAYARRRLEQLNIPKKYDDSKGFYEDMGNPQIAQTYFSNYSTAGEHVYFTSSTMTADTILDSWKTRGIDNPKIKDGCVRADDNFVLLETGSK